MFYFKFRIPKNPDGSPVLYSPNWCGTRDRCAKNEKGLLYNDKELWGIGQAEGAFIPEDVDVITKEDAIATMARMFNISPTDIDISDDAAVIFHVPVNDIEGVYAGEKLAHCWDNIPVAYAKSLTSTVPLILRFPRRSDLTSIYSISIDEIYKFLTLEHANDMVTQGKIRIATLHEFHDTVQYSGSIGDAHEGEKTTRTRKHIVDGRQQDLPDFAQDSLRVADKVNLPNTTFEKFEETPDCYVYCATLKKDAKYWFSLGKDTCVRISDPTKFFEIVSEAIADRAQFVGFAKCIYVHSRVFGSKHPDHPALLKPDNYSKQKEVRAIWRAKDTSVKPFIISEPKIIPLCAMVQ